MSLPKKINILNLLLFFLVSSYFLLIIKDNLISENSFISTLVLYCYLYVIIIFMSTFALIGSSFATSDMIDTIPQLLIISFQLGCIYLFFYKFFIINDITMIPIVALIVIVGISILISPNEVLSDYTNNQGVLISSGTSKIDGGCLITFYILSLITIGLILYSELLYKFFNNGKK